MSAIPATFIDGKIIPVVPPEWPNGKRVLVLDQGMKDELVMLTEEEQRTDPKSIAKWVEWFDSLSPLQMSSEDEASLAEWIAKMKAYNIEAVRRQMEEGIP